MDSCDERTHEQDKEAYKLQNSLCSIGLQVHLVFWFGARRGTHWNSEATQWNHLCNIAQNWREESDDNHWISWAKEEERAQQPVEGSTIDASCQHPISSG